MSHYPHGLDPAGSQQDVYVAAAMEAKANLYREAKAQKVAEAKKKRKSQNNLPAVQTQASQQSLQRTHSPRASMNSMTQQQLAMQVCNNYYYHYYIIIMMISNVLIY